MNKIHQMITDRMISKIEESGDLPFSRMYESAMRWPMNFVSKKPYRGCNVFMLAFEGWKHPYWVTYKQAKSLGGQVKKGEKSTPVVFWKLLQSKKDEDKMIPLLRYYNAFNVGQCEGFEDKIPAVESKALDFDPIASCEAIVQNYSGCPPIRHGNNVCCFNIAKDIVKMIDKADFTSVENYYSVLFHELTHSTGADHRLNRTFGKKHGDSDYSTEELVAEMGAAFLCAEAGILHKTEENSAAYIQGWLEALKADPTMLISAGGAAQKAFEHIVPVKVPFEGNKEVAA